MSRTKIVATLGPATRTPESISRLIEAGVGVFRVNFSHGALEEHRSTISDIRRISETLNSMVAILGDLSGPKIRCGTIKGGPIQLEADAPIRLLMDKEYVGDAEAIGVGYTAMIDEVEEGHRISMNDGAVVLRVISKDRKAHGGRGEFQCTVEQPGEINSRKGINCPDSSLLANPVTEWDRECIEFACKMGLDYLALSFVRSADDIKEAKAAIRSHASDIPVIAKIERHEAVEEIDAITRAADGIMVARGDLGVEIPLQEVPVVQKRLIELCNRLGKPVIVATQMLESMTTSHRPTRAEVSDVANAICDGTDAVMLSAETATGAYPIESVRIMREIALAMEKNLMFDRHIDEISYGQQGNMSDALSRGVVMISRQLKCSAIVCRTRFGSTPRLIARMRPTAKIITFTPSRTWARRLNLVWGVAPYHIATDTEGGASAGALMQEMGLALRMGLVAPGQRITLVSGLSLDDPDSANMMRIIEL